MHRSTERILTTHTGSLPRPRELTLLYAARARGEAVNEGAIERAGREAVRVVKPLREEQSVMRTSLVPSLALALQRDLVRGNVDVRIFEVGAVFLPRAGAESPLPDERWHAAGFAPLRAAWLSRAQGLGGAIRVRLQAGELLGRFAGLDEEGALLLEDAGGRRRIAAGCLSSRLRA